MSKILVEEGKGVTKSQTLLRLDPAERTAALAEATALLRQRAVE